MAARPTLATAPPSATATTSAPRRGPGAEYEIDNFGKEFFIYAPKQPKATKADVVEDGCTWLGEYSSKLQMWACKHRPAAGYNARRRWSTASSRVCYV